MENKKWVPLWTNSVALQKNGWIFVENLCTASVEAGTDLHYGRIISAPPAVDWLRRLDKNNCVILFKKSNNYFEFSAPYKDNAIISCYAIKAQDIIGRFEQASKYFSTNDDEDNNMLFKVK